MELDQRQFLAAQVVARLLQVVVAHLFLVAVVVARGPLDDLPPEPQAEMGVGVL